MTKAKVYFTKEITPDSMIKMYETLGVKLPGKVAVKLHSGEVGNQNFLRPAFMKPIIDHVNGTIVECNTAYAGKRNTTKAHWETMKVHGWTDIATVDIMDEDGQIELEIPHGNFIKKNYVGKNMANYDSMLVLSHFKGHPMGGFGGALKNMSIGVASTAGKLNIHSAGAENQEQSYVWSHLPAQDDFLESMAEACSAVMDYYDKRGGIVYINVINNLSVDCDCDSNPETPCMQDVGIVASLDPVACDRASLDLIYKSLDPGREHFLERVETRHGVHTIEHAVTLELGTTFYEFIDLDK